MPEGPEESTIPAKILAQWTGVTEEELHAGIRSTVKLKDGKYPATAAIQATLAWQRSLLNFIGSKELAEIYGCSLPMVGMLARDGVIRYDATGKLPRKQTMHDIMRHLRDRAGEQRGSSGSIKNESRQLANRLLELQVMKAEGKVVEISVAIQKWSDRVLRVRDKLRRIGNKVAPRWAFVKNEAEAEELINTEVDDICAELSKPIEYADEASEHQSHDQSK